MHLLRRSTMARTLAGAVASALAALALVLAYASPPNVFGQQPGSTVPTGQPVVEVRPGAGVGGPGPSGAASGAPSTGITVSRSDAPAAPAVAAPAADVVALPTTGAAVTPESRTGLPALLFAGLLVFAGITAPTVLVRGARRRDR